MFSITECMSYLRVSSRGPFSLAAALRFLEGFEPAGAGPQAECYRATHVVDGEARLVTVREAADGGLEVSGGPAAAALVRRMFSLDLDGEAFYGPVAARDPVLAALQRRLPGLRPVLFATPWEALCWAILGHRVTMTQAARLKDRVRDAYGPLVDGLRAFPAPEALLDLDGPGVGVPGVKAERLRALAERGAVGELEAERLRELGPDAAREWLERSPGVGPWSSTFCLIRAAGFPDLLPVGERRLDAAIAGAYGPGATLAAVGERWAPLRAWAAFLLRVAAERDAGVTAPAAA
jgi:3-methyladenine DNA glycosylase/8-oxoguanine DNA glycosylase